MSSRAPAWFEQKYKTGAIHVLQDEGYRLRGTTMGADRIVGKKVIFKIAGRGEATKRSAANETRPAMNPDRTTVEADMVDWEANDWIDTADVTKMTENEQQVSQQTAAYAMGRRFDKNIMEALAAESYAGARTIGDGSAPMSIVHPMTASAQILAQGFTAAPELYMPVPQMVMLQLELYKQFSSSEYVGTQPMMKLIGARTYKGVTYIPCPDEYFEAPAAGQFYTYLWQKACVGHVPNKEMTSRIDYVAEKKQWFAANDVASAEKVLLPEGVRRLHFAMPTVLAIPPEVTQAA